MALIDINGKVFMPNVQKVALMLQEAAIVKKILFLKESSINLNSNMYFP